MNDLPDLSALTLWPEWCPAFRGVRLRDGRASPLDKGVENRPMAPWSTIAPNLLGPGRWLAMHAGKHVGGRAGNDGALINVIDTAKVAGWNAYVPRLDDIIPPGQTDAVRLWRKEEGKPFEGIDLHPDDIVTSAIVAVMRVTSVSRPGTDGPWRFPAQWGWHVEVVPLPDPVPCKGAQGLWRVPDDVAARVRAQWVAP